MGFFRNLSMKSKLLGGFTFVIFLSLIIAAVSVYAINRSLEVESELRQTVNVEMASNTKMTFAYNAVHKWLHELQVNANPELVIQGKELVRNMANVAATESLLEPSKTLFPELITEVRQNINLLEKSINGTFMQLLDQGRYAEADAVFLKEVLPYSSKCNSLYAQINKNYIDIISSGINQLDLFPYMVVVIVVAAVAVVIALFLSFAISGYITSHTKAILDNAKEIENGNFNIKFDDIPGDEIGDIYKSFSQIADTLNNTIARVISVSNALKEYSNELHSASQSINEGARVAESHSITVAAAADEMVSTTTDIAKNCHTAQDTSEGAKQETNAGVDKVRTTVARIKEQSIQTRDDAEKVLRLAEQSQKIGSIVGTIDEIAAQTNLLALNAAIEAARAGEAGRGFAVVADEVRALASRTSKSTQEITSMVKSVQEDSKTATDSMSASVTQMEEMASKAGELEETLNNIMASVNNVNSQIMQIATAAEEQTTATAEISSNMQNITDMAQNSVDVATNAVGISNHAIDLIDTLMRDLSFFKLNEAKIDRSKLISIPEATPTQSHAAPSGADGEELPGPMPINN